MTTLGRFHVSMFLWMHDDLLLPNNPWGETQRLPSIRLLKTLNVSTEKVLNETASSLNEKLDVIPPKACSYENGGGNDI